MCLIPSFGQHKTKEIINGKEKYRLVNKEIFLMKSFSESLEYDIFTTDAMKNYIEFEWKKQGWGHHALGSLFHIYHIVYIGWYINMVYINAELQSKKEKGNIIERHLPQFFLPLAIVYPTFYETLQLIETGFIEYFTSIQNIQAVLFIGTGIANVYFQLTPYTFNSRLVIVLNLVLSITRTLEMFRLFDAYMPIVTMMTGVITEFKEFILFLFILILFFSLGMDIMQVDNPAIS